MADRRRRELERAIARGDPEARRQWIAERVRAGELSLERPSDDCGEWVSQLMAEGLLSRDAVVRLVERDSQQPGPWDGRSWWWVETMLGSEASGWRLSLVRLSQRGRRPLARHDATSRARNVHQPLFPKRFAYAKDRVDAAAWFAENLLEVSLTPLPRAEAEQRHRQHAQERRDQRRGERTWEPRALLEEYAAFPEWHEGLSVQAFHLNAGRDLPLVLVARRGRRGVWHVVNWLTLEDVAPACATSPRDDYFQGEVAWGEPTCVRCRRKTQWDTSMGPGRRAERRRTQKGYLARLVD